jgi:hypothetical protein
LADTDLLPPSLWNRFFATLSRYWSNNSNNKNQNKKYFFASVFKVVVNENEEGGGGRRGVERLATVRRWFPTEVIDVCLLFNVAVVFSLLFFRFPCKGQLLGD